jgi:hypothetical protein
MISDADGRALRQRLCRRRRIARGVQVIAPFGADAKALAAARFVLWSGGEAFRALLSEMIESVGPRTRFNLSPAGRGRFAPGDAKHRPVQIG